MVFQATTLRLLKVVPAVRLSITREGTALAESSTVTSLMHHASFPERLIKDVKCLLCRLFCRRYCSGYPFCLVSLGIDLVLRPAGSLDRLVKQQEQAQYIQCFFGKTGVVGAIVVNLVRVAEHNTDFRVIF